MQTTNYTYAVFGCRQQAVYSTSLMSFSKDTNIPCIAASIKQASSRSQPQVAKTASDSVCKRVESSHLWLVTVD